MQLVEEATQLLRRCPAGAWLWHFAGGAPFVCMVLHFWNDMTRSGDAERRLPLAAVGLAAAFLWMKIAQTIFADRLMRVLRDEKRPPAMPFRGRLRLVSSQALIHATMPWVLSLAGVAVLPFGWAYAFYHSATTLAISHFRAGGNTRGLIKASLAQAHHQPGANHALMLVILITALMIWLNFHGGVITAAHLLRAFTGSENAISRTPAVMFDSGLIAATAMLAWFVCGPFVRAVYALRCFYGLSRKNAEDLFAALRTMAPAGKPALTAAFLLLALTPVQTELAPAQKADAAQFTPADQQRAAELDQRIHQVLQEEMFRWRMPREKLDSDEEGPITRLITDIGQWISDAWKSLWDAIRDLWRKLFPERSGGSEDDGSMATPWSASVKLIVYILAGALLILLAFLVWKQWKQAGPRPAAAAPATPPVDLQSEQVLASQLPENEWLRLAQEKLDAGEYRLALRALFLASLAHLGDRRLIAISRAKSNGDYLRELSFRARDRSELRECFQENVRTFDRTWYGWHEVNREALDHFRSNHDLIASDGTVPMSGSPLVASPQHG